AVDIMRLGDAQPGPGNRAAIEQIDLAGVADRGQITEYARAGDRPGAVHIIVERRGGDRDIAVDVAAVVDRDVAAGFDNGVSRGGHGGGDGGPDGAGVVDQRRAASRVLLHEDRRVSGWSQDRAGIGDVD